MQIRGLANELDRSNGVQNGKVEAEITALSKRVERIHVMANKMPKRHYKEDFETATPPSHRKRIKQRPKLSTEEKISIAFRVIHELETGVDVAKEFRIS